MNPGWRLLLLNTVAIVLGCMSCTMPSFTAAYQNYTGRPSCPLEIGVSWLLSCQQGGDVLISTFCEHSAHKQPKVKRNFCLLHLTVSSLAVVALALLFSVTGIYIAVALFNLNKAQCLRVISFVQMSAAVASMIAVALWAASKGQLPDFHITGDNERAAWEYLSSDHGINYSVSYAFGFALLSILVQIASSRMSFTASSNNEESSPSTSVARMAMVMLIPLVALMMTFEHIGYLSYTSGTRTILAQSSMDLASTADVHDDSPDASVDPGIPPGQMDRDVWPTRDCVGWTRHNLDYCAVAVLAQL